ncbi:MAG: hypothetical protein IKG59_00835 [Firmicutes bacterium]|nr:hypothetical protein [Bacillota bacterium]MBR3052655.1 hypothetical protein [Bacillota bacterium]
MTNHENYKRAASSIEPSAGFADKVLKEAEKDMKTNRRHGRRTFLVICAAVILVLALGAVSYATDIAGFRHNVDTWLYGEPVKVDIEQTGEYEYTITYPDGSQRQSGGIAYEKDGPRPLTADEILEEMNRSVELDIKEDGRAFLYYRDHVVDVTEDLADDGVAKVKFKDGALPMYVKLKVDGEGYSVSTGHFGF